MTIMRIQFSILFLVICISIGYGKRPKKILESDEIRNAPFQVAIHDPLLLHRCGGAIISPTHILTGAHCIVDSSGGTLLSSASRIIVGATDMRKLTAENLYNIVVVRVHEDYNASDSYHNDIAIIKLDRAIEFTKNRRPISLPVSETTDGTLVMAIGWGVTKYDHSTNDIGPYSDTLRRSLEQVISRDECQRMMGKEFIHPEQICAWSLGRTITCYGDSGGPLVEPSSIVGIISFNEYCNPSYPTIYTRVYKYVEWIENVMKFL